MTLWGIRETLEIFLGSMGLQTSWRASKLSGHGRFLVSMSLQEIFISFYFAISIQGMFQLYEIDLPTALSKRIFF